MGFGKVWGWTSGVHCDIYSMGSVIKPDDEQFLVVTAKFTSTLAMLIVSAKTVATAMVLIMKWPTFDMEPSTSLHAAARLRFPTMCHRLEAWAAWELLEG